MTGTVRNRASKNLAAGAFQPVINSFALHLRAEGKSPKTVRTYVEAAGWFAAEHLRKQTECTCWEDVALGLQVLKSVEQPTANPHPGTDLANGTVANQDRGEPRNARPRHTDLVNQARTALTEDPTLTGHHLGHLPHVSERTGRRLLRRAAATHGSNPDRSNG